MDHHHHPTHAAGLPLVWLMVWFLLGMAGLAYSLAVRQAQSGGGRRRWALTRSLAWYGGLGALALGLTGPIATRADRDFAVHVIGHLLTGMLGPLLLVCGAPLTVALRALPTASGRALSRSLRTPLMRALTQPVLAGVVAVGSLAVIYLTGVYRYAMDHAVVHAVVQVHVVLAGYLFAHSIVGRDPGTRRSGYTMRAVGLVAMVAAHGILAKYLYAHPPAGVSQEAAQRGAVVMYYGGDVIDGLLMFVLCREWYIASRAGRIARAERWQTAG